MVAAKGREDGGTLDGGIDVGGMICGGRSMAAFPDGRKKWIYWFISGKLVSKFAFLSLNPRS